MLLTKEAILAAKDLRCVDVDVPEWGGSVRLRPMNGADRERLQGYAKNDLNKFAVRLLSECVVSEDGQKVFTHEDIDSLLSKNGAVIDRLALKCMELNGLAADSVEKAEKNS